MGYKNGWSFLSEKDPTKKKDERHRHKKHIKRVCVSMFMVGWSLVGRFL